MTRTFVIGDIHGAAKALQQLVEKLALTENDSLVFLGDYVDGWSQSAQVIEYLMLLDKKYKCVFIRGNHDSWCEEWLRDGTANETWLFHGGRSTVSSYNSLTAE